ncbi:MAG: ATP-dependent RecD-like DNA helicase [Kiritimatiellae bacterium]|nr:ATP-dependent RecD-like DNA helicase [Kiritimatiellia bacterium]
MRSEKQTIGDDVKLDGSVEAISFRNDETGYVVCTVKPADRANGTVTVVGNCAAIWVGEELTATGHWVNDSRFGLQFRADSIVCVAPTSTEGVRRFLAGGLIRGIGKIHADRIVDKFGSDTLHVIEHASRRLMEVDGIGQKRCDMIRKSWQTLRGVRDVMIFLQSHGVGMGQASRIYRTYGDQAIAVVKSNPYRLCRDVFGFGFLTADSIALKLGMDREAPERARGGLLHVLQTLQDDGHCFCEDSALLLTAQSHLGISVEKLAEALDAIIEEGTAVRDGNRIYLKELYQAECNVARRLAEIASAPPPFREIDANRALAWAEAKMRLVLAGEQRRAIASGVTSKASVITGGPGVGKTTIIRALVEIFQIRKLNIQLAAPTGRAAKRMAEATGREAQTIHRLLKYLPPKHAFAHDESNPIDADVLIVDESSMIDIILMDQLLRALPDRITLVLVGDTDQLPSVGPGNVLRDVIASNAIPCTRLDTIFRQDTRGMIVRNAHHINNGEELEAGGSDFFFIETPDPDRVVTRVCELVTTRIPAKFHIPPQDIQVLTPMRKNQLGADNLNVVLQQSINPTGPSLRRGLTVFRRGDRVMQLRNNYDKEVFNGDVGFIGDIDAEEDTLQVDFDGRRVEYERGDLDELVLAYASTVHKSQGSEYPAVVIVIATQHFKLLQRNLLYTAVTRGRKLVCVVGTHKAAAIATRNNDVRARQTALAERLSAALLPR